MGFDAEHASRSAVDAGQNAGQSPAASSPRAVLLAQLSDGLRLAVASGDVEAARIAHETIGRLLGMPHAPGELRPVVDLATERSKRGGR